MDFLAQAIGTPAIKQAIFAGVPATARAVIGGAALLQLAPAIFAQVVISLAYTFTAVNTYCRPQKMIHAL